MMTTNERSRSLIKIKIRLKDNEENITRNMYRLFYRWPYKTRCARNDEATLWNDLQWGLYLFMDNSVLSSLCGYHDSVYVLYFMAANETVWNEETADV